MILRGHEEAASTRGTNGGGKNLSGKTIFYRGDINVSQGV